MATKYKIGDKVVLTSVEDWEEDSGLRVGMEGTIVDFIGWKSANVSFDGWNEGHTNKERSCWIVALE